MVLEEVERIGLGTDRLIRTLSLPDHEQPQPTDLDQLLGHVLDRWRVLADRDWQLDSTAGVQICSPERTRVCLDTLLENSVRYTRDGDVVRLVSSVEDDVLSIGVADAGDGFHPYLLASLRDESPVPSTDQFAADPKSQTGLGLGLVREAVRVRGGDLVMGESPEGGRPGADAASAGARTPGPGRGGPGGAVGADRRCRPLLTQRVRRLHTASGDLVAEVVVESPGREVADLKLSEDRCDPVTGNRAVDLDAARVRPPDAVAGIVHPVRQVGLDRLVHAAGRGDQTIGVLELDALLQLLGQRPSSGGLCASGLAAASFGAGAVAEGGVGSPQAGPDLLGADLSDLTGMERVACHEVCFLVERQLDGGKRVAAVSGR